MKKWDCGRVFHFTQAKNGWRRALESNNQTREKATKDGEAPKRQKRAEALNLRSISRLKSVFKRSENGGYFIYFNHFKIKKMLPGYRI